MSSLSRSSDSSRRDRMASSNLEDSFFPFSPSSQNTGSVIHPASVHGYGPIPEPEVERSGPLCEDSNPLLLERDLILAAELGQALLERNEDLAAQLEQKEKEVEALQQERFELQQRLDVLGLEGSQREAEQLADIAALREKLDRQLRQAKDRRQEESEQLKQLSSHNQRLVEQLAEAVSVEHSLRSELRSLREEMEDGSLSRSISSARLDSLQAENRVLQERKVNAEERLRSMQEDNSRLRAERDGLRGRVTELQATLSEKDGELDQECSSSFQLRTQYHTLQQKIQDLGGEVIPGGGAIFPLSLQCEIQQSQAKEAIQVHSEILQEKDTEIQKLKSELLSKDKELESLKEELQPFRQTPGKPGYSTLEWELAAMQRERDSLNQQLLNTIKHKVMLSQEVEAWQEDMRLVIRHQVEQREEKQKEKRGLSRDTRTSKSLRLRGEGGKKDKGGFFSSFFSAD
ncbi:BICD family-like cargo adapter 2 [Paramormyrops kingsleyae]|uniref:BICD family-like cargo adapter 2 n=1 Tax=Paramormyrops kingsleyae TaxID=1676925 RepID=A0A3B3S8F6_9TELE|nr:BICD family-like cargo adapter 2 [Paramormyrops kingsleyae]XP_023669405.1 BICD family-like cargo adapter 2 [Paramormyrops kingsleyae]